MKKSGLVLLFVLLCALLVPAAAYAGPAHTTYQRSVNQFSGGSAIWNVSGLWLNGVNDLHEICVLATSSATNGAPYKPTFAIALGRSSGYSCLNQFNELATTLGDQQLHMFTLSTWAFGDVNAGGTYNYYKNPATDEAYVFQPNTNYSLAVKYSGERRWLPHSNTPVRGVTADWYDGVGHYGYLWEAWYGGNKIADCWLDAPVAEIKLETNKFNEANTVWNTNYFSSAQLHNGTNWNLWTTAYDCRRAGFGGYYTYQTTPNYSGYSQLAPQ